MFRGGKDSPLVLSVQVSTILNSSQVPKGREYQLKAQCASSFQAFPYITFANILFMETSQDQFQGTLRQHGRSGKMILQKEVRTGMRGIGDCFATNHDLPSTLTTRTVLSTSPFPKQERGKQCSALLQHGRSISYLAKLTTLEVCTKRQES